MHLLILHPPSAHLDLGSGESRSGFAVLLADGRRTTLLRHLAGLLRDSSGSLAQTETALVAVGLKWKLLFLKNDRNSRKSN